jgi:hypothetical protein
METKFHLGRRTGVARQVGNVQITPESLVLLVRLGSFGHVWNWPVAVTVARPYLPPAGDAAHNGGPGATAGMPQSAPQIERKAIVDVTRIAEWALGAATLFVVLLAWFGPPSRQGRKRKPV